MATSRESSLLTTNSRGLTSPTCGGIRTSVQPSTPTARVAPSLSGNTPLNVPKQVSASSRSKFACCGTGGKDQLSIAGVADSGILQGLKPSARRGGVSEQKRAPKTGALFRSIKFVGSEVRADGDAVGSRLFNKEVGVQARGWVCDVRTGNVLLVEQIPHEHACVPAAVRRIELDLRVCLIP